MKLAFVHLLINLSFCLAVPEFSLAPSCDNDGDFRRRDGIIGQILDAIGLARNAHRILTDHIDDKYVLDMTKAMLGNSDFQAKLDKIKENLKGISEISETPSHFMPLDEGWTARRSNLDVAFWCDGSRFPQARTVTAYHQGWSRWIAMNVTGKLAECYATDYQLGSGASSVKAMTTPSHVVDWRSFTRDRENGAKVKKTDPQYRMMRRDSNDIDLCKWFVETADQQGWPKIDKARVDKASTNEFREGLIHPTVPIDGVKTLGSTVLHEFTHTNQGGLLLDTNVEDIKGVSSCYGWLCAGMLEDANNSDSIALLGIALKIWTFGYYVDREGNILPRP